MQLDFLNIDLLTTPARISTFSVGLYISLFRCLAFKGVTSAMLIFNIVTMGMDLSLELRTNVSLVGSRSLTSPSCNLHYLGQGKEKASPFLFINDAFVFLSFPALPY